MISPATHVFCSLVIVCLVAFIVVAAIRGSINSHRLEKIRLMSPSQVRFKIVTLKPDGPYRVDVFGTDGSGPIMYGDREIKAKSEWFSFESSAEHFVENFFNVINEKNKFPQERTYNPHIKTE